MPKIDPETFRGKLYLLMIDRQPLRPNLRGNGWATGAVPSLVIVPASRSPNVWTSCYEPPRIVTPIELMEV